MNKRTWSKTERSKQNQQTTLMMIMMMMKNDNDDKAVATWGIFLRHEYGDTLIPNLQEMISRSSFSNSFGATAPLPFLPHALAAATVGLIAPYALYKARRGGGGGGSTFVRKCVD
jgi:hypothetical protein